MLGAPISLATNGGSVTANNMLDKVFISVANDGVYAYQLLKWKLDTARK